MIMSRRLAILRIGATVCLGLVFALSGCAARKGLIVEPAQPQIVYDAKPVAVLQGKASYYYGRWIGRKTANGEIYRAKDVTAAHKTLPFNTMARVTNLKNGKSVMVRINNRGPYIMWTVRVMRVSICSPMSRFQPGMAATRYITAGRGCERGVAAK